MEGFFLLVKCGALQLDAAKFVQPPNRIVGGSNDQRVMEDGGEG